MPDPDTARPGTRRVVVAGASGLIGSALVESLRADGVTVTTLVRRPPEAPDEVEWLTDATPLDPAVLAGADAVVGLNGASIGRFPWTEHYKSTLLWSRITPTQAIARAVRELGTDAPAFVSASAVGYYGSAPRKRLDETSRRGETFLADLCGEWEAAARASGEHARVALLRTAPIIHAQGVLKPLLLLTKLGVSGPIGRGTQVWPWITLDDEVRAIRHVIDKGLDGPVNLTGPTRATANDLGFALAVRLNRPFLVRAPVWAMKLALGEDATEAVLTTDAHVEPAVLEASGFSFLHPTVEDAVAAAVPAAGETPVGARA
ncbi:TIGR01777 family oxidoreductase [Microbacterium sp. HJ5]